MKEYIASILSIVTTAFLYLLGGLDVALECLLIAIVIDYVSGLIKAYNTRTISSKIGFKGILKKVGILCIVAVSVLVDRIAGDTGAVRTLVIYYFVANEGLSLIENLGEAGVPVPEVVRKALTSLKDKGSDNG